MISGWAEGLPEKEDLLSNPRRAQGLAVATELYGTLFPRRVHVLLVTYFGRKVLSVWMFGYFGD